MKVEVEIGPDGKPRVFFDGDLVRCPVIFSFKDAQIEIAAGGEPILVEPTDVKVIIYNSVQF